jgi:site-specific DNA recombinase
VRAAVYLRQSKDTTGERVGVDRQARQCHKLAEARGWQVVATYEDNDTSASVAKRRPGYTTMLKAAEAGDFDVIVAYHADRLTRRLVDLEELLVLSQRTGVKVATVTGDLDLTNDTGRLVARILASVAAGEVERKSGRQRDANRDAAEAGRPPQRRAFGYAEGGMTLLDTEAEAVRDTYAQLLTGATLVALARRLNRHGFTTTRGRPWQRSAVRAMLLSPRYKGTRVYRGEEIGPGTWPPIVTEETWQAARLLLTDDARRKNDGTARRWLGGGLYLCGKCSDTARSDMRVNYRGPGERVYRCRERSHMTRLADPVDDLVSGVIVARLRRDDLADLLARPDSAVPVLDLRRECVTLRERMDAYGVDLADGVLTSGQVRRATQRLQHRLDDVERQLADAGRRSALDAMLGTPDPGAAWLAADLDQKRAVLDMLVTVVLLPTRGAFRPESVWFDWREHP